MSDASTSADPTASLRRIRWAQGITFGVVGLALVGTAAQSLIGAQRSTETLTIGQGNRLLAAVQAAHHRFGPQIDEHATEVLEQHEQFGLRCIGLFRRDHVRRIGDCLLSESAMRDVLADTLPDEPITVGDHVVMIDAPGRGPGPPGGGPSFDRNGLDGRRIHPPRPPDGGPDAQMRSRPPEGPPAGGAETSDRRGPRRGRGRRGGAPILPSVLIEFEPIEAETLRASVTTGAVVAFIAVIALLASGIVLFRLTRRAEVLQEEAERDRRLVTLGEMASVLAHEIRNPLAALKGHAQLLAEQLPEEGGERRGAERVVRSAVRLESLTEDLLSLVRSNQVERRDVSLETLIRDSLAQVDFDRFDVDLARAPDRWELDPARMQQVLVNLLQNAAEASPEGARAAVEVLERSGTLVLLVRDSGDGIPTGEKDRIFDPFVTTRTQGTGLGLAVARRIVELHGGTISGRNLDSGGAEFEVVIP